MIVEQFLNENNYNTLEFLVVYKTEGVRCRNINGFVNNIYKNPLEYVDSILSLLPSNIKEKWLIIETTVPKNTQCYNMYEEGGHLRMSVTNN